MVRIIKLNLILLYHYIILIYQIGVYASDRVLRAAFETEGYHRRIARAKPYLSAANKECRLTWAKEHENWNVQDWLRVIWTDEAAFYVGGFRGRFG